MNITEEEIMGYNRFDISPALVDFGFNQRTNHPEYIPEIDMLMKNQHCVEAPKAISNPYLNTNYEMPIGGIELFSGRQDIIAWDDIKNFIIFLIIIAVAMLFYTEEKSSDPFVYFNKLR